MTCKGKLQVGVTGVVLHSSAQVRNAFSALFVGAFVGARSRSGTLVFGALAGIAAFFGAILVACTEDSVGQPLVQWQFESRAKWLCSDAFC